MIPEKPMHPTMKPHAGLPKEVWLGKKDGEWPVHLFHTAAEAQQWQASHDSRVRRVWEVSLAEAIERIVIFPEPVGLKWAGEFD